VNIFCVDDLREEINNSENSHQIGKFSLWKKITILKKERCRSGMFFPEPGSDFYSSINLTTLKIFNFIQVRKQMLIYTEMSILTQNFFY